LRFHAAINAQNRAALGALMSEDHRFIDAAGSEVTVRTAALAAWHAFFGMFPDYANLPQETRTFGNAVAMAGESRCSDSRLAGPALWRALIAEGLIAEWQVYRSTLEDRKLLGFE
jgi:ketosteroid isomerase-like protein